MLSAHLSAAQAYAFSPDNFVGAFSDPSVLAVLCIALVFGFAMAAVRPRSGETHVLVDMISQLREVSATCG